MLFQVCLFVFVDPFKEEDSWTRGIAAGSGLDIT